MDMEALRQAATNFSDGYQQAYDPNGFVQRKRLQADMAYQQQLRDRQAEQWRREDEHRAAIQQLGFEAKNGAMVEGSDNSFDVAEGKRLGMPVKSTVQRTPMSEADIEGRMGAIALNSGDLAGYRQSRTNQKALVQEAANREFGARMAAFLKGDDNAIADIVTNGNLDGGILGTLTKDEKGVWRYGNPRTLASEPVDRATIAQILYQAHAFGQGDVMGGLRSVMGLQQNIDQRADAERKYKLDERQVANQEAATKQQGDYQRGSLDIQRQKLGIDRMEAGARVAAANAAANGARVAGSSLVVDANGNYAREVLLYGKDGSVKSELVPMPPGWQPPKGMDPAAIGAMAAPLVGTPMNELDASGKPRMRSFADAVREVQGAFGQPRGPAASPVGRDADAVTNFLRSEADKLPKDKPKSAMPGRQESTTQAQRLRQMYIEGSR